MTYQESFTLFADTQKIAAGTISDVVEAAKRQFDGDPNARLLVYSDATGRSVDFDLSGSTEEVLEREVQAHEARSQKRRGRGRPKLGVDCGEICLLPRHWEWLNAQPRSASATIRRLIDAARKSETPEDRARERIDAAGAFMWAIAGDLPSFEEATRALYKKDWTALRQQIKEWPTDINSHVWYLIGDAVG